MGCVLRMRPRDSSMLAFFVWPRIAFQKTSLSESLTGQYFNFSRLSGSKPTHRPALRHVHRGPATAGSISCRLANEGVSDQGANIMKWVSQIRKIRIPTRLLKYFAGLFQGVDSTKGVIDWNVVL